MFRFSISEKYLCFIPALLLTSQIFYRILFLQAAGSPEVTAFSVIPTVLSALAIGIFFRRIKISKQSRLLLHTLLFALLVCATLLRPTHLYGTELILLCILTGMIFASVQDTKGVVGMALGGVIAAGLLFAPTQPSVRYINFILLPFAQFCLLSAYFAIYIPRKQKIFSGISLLLSLVVAVAVTWVLFNRENTKTNEHYFQEKHQIQLIHGEQYFLSILAATCQEKINERDVVRVTIIETDPFPIAKTLETLKEYGLPVEITSITPDFTKNSQRILPVMRPSDITPAEIPDFLNDPDVVFVAPPIPTERSAAFLSSATFFQQIVEKMPDSCTLAVYASGNAEQNQTIYNSMPLPVKRKDGTETAGTVCFPMGNASLFVYRKDGKDPLRNSAELAKNLPSSLAGYNDLLELVFPAQQANELPPQNPELANRPFHSELLQQCQPTVQNGFFHFVIRWHGLVFVTLLGIYLLLRYFISWKPVHKPCFQAFEAGLLVMLLPAGAVIAGASMGCGPIFSLIPTITTVFCGTFLFLLITSAKERFSKFDCIPLLLVIFMLLLGWNLPAAAAMIGALALKAFLGRETPDLSPEMRIFPKIWLMIGMSIALILAGLFLIMPI